MLQIISGKFFKSNDLYTTQAYGITYTNFSWISKIETKVATLEPVETYLTTSSYVIRYENKIEKNNRGKLTRIGDSEIITQFQLLCSFGLKVFFNSDRNYVEYLCRKDSLDYADHYQASLYVSHFFTPKVFGKNEDVKYFSSFINKVIDLPRKTYTKIISCITNFLNALEFLSFNPDLSYSMMIYTLESLSQKFDSYQPQWEDYYQASKHKLEKLFPKLNGNEVREIKNILLSEANLKSQKRFIDFINENINDDYFINSSKEVVNALKKTELLEALKNAYQLRSKYSHELESILKQLKITGIRDHDVFRWDKKPFLTLKGLTRLTHYVISNFIWKQPSIEQEEFDWEMNIPGVVQLELSPKYWIANTNNLNQNDIIKKFSGFLSIYQDLLLEKEKDIPSLQLLLEEIEKMMPTAKKENRYSMIALYYFYNKVIEKQYVLVNADNIIDKYNHFLKECTIENLIIYLLTSQNWVWSIDKCILIFEDFNKNKFNKNSIEIPTFIYLALIVTIGNHFLILNKINQYNLWQDKAILESAGFIEIQKYILTCKALKNEIDVAIILKNKVII